MKRGEPLKRLTPLVAKTGLVRRTPLQRKAGREQLAARAMPMRRVAMAQGRRAPAVPRRQRDRLRERAGGWCEIRQSCCLGQGTDPAHRVSRGMGGRHGAAAIEAAQLSNVVWACRACHQLCHQQPRFAERMGWFVREGADPRAVQVLIGGRMVLLDDEGGVADASTDHGLKGVG